MARVEEIEANGQKLFAIVRAMKLHIQIRVKPTFPFLTQWVFHKGTASALLPSPPHLSQFLRKCDSFVLLKDQALGFPTEIQYADDTDMLFTSHIHLEEVMEVLDRELQPRQDTIG